MELIWANREAIYFYERGWTGSISLIGKDKYADWRKGYRRRSMGNFAKLKLSKPVFPFQLLIPSVLSAGYR